MPVLSLDGYPSMDGPRASVRHPLAGFVLVYDSAAALVPAPRRDGSRPSLVRSAAGVTLDLTLAHKCRCGRRTKKDRRRIEKAKPAKAPNCQCPWYWQLKVPQELQAAGRIQYSRVLGWALLGAPWEGEDEAHGWVVHHEPGCTYFPHHDGRRDREVKDDRRLANLAWARRGREHAALEGGG